VAGRAKLWDSLRRAMRSRFLLSAGLPIVSLTMAAAGCTIGNGSGTAKGMLWILGCEDGGNYGSPTAPLPFDLSPTYFAGEPIEDIGDVEPAHNRLIIRMQRNGNALEITDTLYFDIPFSYQIAQCLRGRTVGGVPDWDTSSGTTDPAGAPWCGPVGDNGVPRINLFPYGPVTATLTPFGTCHSQAHPPTVVSVAGVASPGWIDFLAFGSAMQPTLPPDQRGPVDPNFKVAYGERLQAIFGMNLEDNRVANAVHLGINQPMDPIIGGTMDGRFDFDLERGRSAQTFP
jgi:hypothetical protein